MIRNDQQQSTLKLTSLHKIGYGVGNLGYGIILQIIASFLVFYSTAVLQIPGSLVGLAISISVIWDAISDPIMGYISDRTYSNTFGRRHLYIIIGTFTISVSNYLLWLINKELSNIVKFIWILVGILLLKTFITIYTTPYNALGAELSKDYHERTSIQAIKTVFFLLGLFFGAAITLVLFFKSTSEFPIGQLNPKAYKNMAISSSILMFISGLICFYSTIKFKTFTVSSNKENTKISSILDIFIGIKEALKQKNYRYVAVGYLLTNISSALVGTIGLHVFTYTFLMNNYKIGIIVGVQLLISIISQPVWIYISKKIDKKPSVIIGLIISIFASFIFIILVLNKNIVRENYLYLILFALFGGFGTGGLYSLPLSMIADTTDEEELKSGMRKEGVYYGGLTLLYKLSHSIAIFILGIVLDVIKFDASKQIQSELVTTSLGLLLPIGSIISFSLAVYFYNKYSLTKERVNYIQSKL